MAHLIDERLFGGLQPDGWHYPPVRKLRLRRQTRRKSKPANEFTMDEGTVDSPASVEDLTERINELEREGNALRARVHRLQDAGKAIIAQREEWRSRALVAEELLESERGRSMSDQRFDTLRRIIAKELHPDHCAGGDFEKLARSEFFKRLWPEIERIAGQK